MKVTLNFEETSSSDVSIMVDVLRASTTITFALDNFNEIIPCFSPQEAFKIKDMQNGVIAGERGGKTIEGFDVGNSPEEVKNFKTDLKTLILTTTNGTRILESMDSTVLVGCLANAKAVANKSVELAESHIDVVMAGVRGKFALEDFLAAGEIIYQITQCCSDCKISDWEKSAILASRDYELLKNAFRQSRSGKHLTSIGYGKDVEFCLNKNISNNVGIYKNNKILNI